jgi:hypothetical protein
MRKLTPVRLAALALLVSASVPVVAALRGPDAAGYSATDATVFSFVDVSGGGASVLAGTDDGTAPLTLPFPFTFYGQSYTQVCVSSNGAIYFAPSAASCTGVNDFANIDLALTTPNDWPAVFPYWTDLTFQAPGAGSVFYQTQGAAGDRRFVVQWNNAMPGSSSSPVTFQAILSEGTNTIAFQYKTVTLGAGNPASNGAQATVGIRNSGGNSSNKLLAWSFNAPVLRDGVAIVFGNSTADSAPPVVTATAAPTSLWPPNGKTVKVVVTGSIRDAASAINASSVRYSVVDSYGQVQPAGAITLAASGSYSVSIPLIAARNGTDKAGRTYRITIRAADAAGNAGTATVVVTVPHDQGK